MATHECTFPGDARAFSKVAAGAGLRQPRNLRADHAAAAGCRRLLDNMVTHEDGVRRGLGMECLHHFRVSVRRTRSLLIQLDEVFSPDAVARFRREFKWLASATGAARDLDVHLLKMDEYHARLPADTADHLTPLDEFLRHRRGVEGRQLSKALGSKRYGKLVEDWRRFLHGDIAGDSPPAHARRSVVDVARATIWRAYRLVRRHGRNIDADSSAEALHELRLDCKKLRYLLEFFCDLFDEDDIAPLLKSLKRLQSNLGDLNDLEVQQRTLQRFASEMDPREPVAVQCRRAIVRLLEHLPSQRISERRRFASSLEQFSASGNRARFERLFRPLAPARFAGPLPSPAIGSGECGEY